MYTLIIIDFFLFRKIKSENLGFYFSFFLHLLILFSAIGLPNFFDPKTNYYSNNYTN